MPFLANQTVRFAHVDAAGIAYFSRIFEFCHAAYEELLGECGYPLTEFFKSLGWGMPLVHAEADFKRPLKLGDSITIAITLGSVSTSAFTLDFQLHDSAGKLLATVQHVHVAIDLSTRAKKALPEAFVASLKQAAS
jgi:1,4-dihydroxy-2-naphthoyl-CoA hydrolase